MIIDSPIISGSYAASGSLNQFGNVVISGSLTVTGSIIGTASFATTASYLSGYVSPFPYTGSAIISGSLTVTGSANIPSITGSLQGSASFASTASFVTTAQTASFVTTAQTASFVATAQTASYVLNAVSSSFATSASQALTASYLTGYVSPFPFTGSAIISGSLTVTGSVAVNNLQGSGVRYLVADATGSITAQSASAALKSTQAFTATAGQTTFSVTNGYSTGYVDVFVNGSKLNSTEFTDTSGTNIVLTTGSFVDDVVEVVKYIPAAGVTNNVLRQLTTFTASAGQTVFSASYTPGLLDIFYNGSRLSTSDYTANNGTYFTLATASVANDILDVLVYSYQVGAFSGIGGQGVTNQIAYFNTTSSITGSNNFTISGSTMTVTGSLVVTGSGTFTNIGPAVMSGSLTVSGAITTNSTITATTLVVQTVTSSNSQISGSTKFGTLVSDTHQFTGSIYTSGSGNFTGSIAAGSTGQVGLFGTSNTSDKYLSVNNSAGTFDFGTNSTGNYIQANNINPLKFVVNTSNTAMFISASGNVGIGTTSPQRILHLNAASDTRLMISDSVVSATSGLYLRQFGSNSAIVNQSNGTFQLATNDTYFLTATGSNVGIGTTTPTSRLDLGTGTGGTILTIQDGFVKHITSGFVVGSQYYYGSNQYGQIAASSTGFNFNTYNGVNMTFGNGSYSPYLQFKSGGGTSYGNYITMDNANDFLCVAAGTDAGYAFGPYMQMVGKNRYGTNTAGWIDYAAGNASGNTSYGYHAFYTANTLRMAISWNGSIGTTSIGSTNIYNPSDIRLKRNIVPVSYGLDAVMALKPSKFNWREKFSAAEEDKDLLGFIAQEVQTVIPEAVESFGQNIHVNVDEVEYTVENPLRVNEKFIIPVLVKAIQEQQALITSLQTRIEQLENK